MKEKDMGKLKQAMIQFNEERSKRSAGSKTFQNLDPRLSGMEDSDEEWAIHEAEFNDWLDKYEQSFGGEEGQL
jgi:hypothetical protein